MNRKGAAMRPSDTPAVKRLGTRERIIQLLMRSGQTIEHLSKELMITKNAVRSQIALLQREGLVDIQGEVRGSRRPAALYRVRPGADVLFSKAYPVFLSHLVNVLARKVPSGKLRGIMKAAGRDIADSVPRLDGSPRERMVGAARFLQSLGSLAEVREEDGTLVIQGYGCLISKAVRADERSCAAMEALLGRITGLQITERCSHGECPSCRFETSAKE